MPIVKFLGSLTEVGRWVLAGLVLVLLIGGLFTLRTCQSATVAQTEAKLGRNQTGAAIASGSDAVETVGDVSTRATETDTTTRENADAIRKADGADVPVADGAHAAGMWALCKRPAYRGREQCMQFTPAR